MAPGASSRREAVIIGTSETAGVMEALGWDRAVASCSCGLRFCRKCSVWNELQNSGLY